MGRKNGVVPLQLSPLLSSTQHFLPSAGALPSTIRSDLPRVQFISGFFYHRGATAGLDSATAM